MRPALLRWQLDGYPQFHSDRTNLLLHIVAVPAFVASFGSLILNVCTLRWAGALGSLLGMVVAFVVQAVGHKRDAPPIPFEGPGDAVTRIFAEQLVTFPRFVLSGGFRAALRRSRQPQ